MGRGRAKAKQTRIARELKYFSQPTDFHALEQELSSDPRSAAEPEEDTAAWTDDADLPGSVRY
ncbi:DUF3073 domain-containing protein [Dactylosporangium sp. CS-033363]|uniref:DUF3073 domain-containing protein n=1 Tax=Dactylosporangium sp. CS-033363 TaxID=3239935 RepID=UPI003D94B69F